MTADGFVRFMSVFYEIGRVELLRTYANIMRGVVLL